MASPAAACEASPPLTFADADLVLTGTVVQRDDPGFLFMAGPNDVITWTIDVDNVEKGSVSRQFLVSSRRDAACGAALAVGHRYRLMATVGANGQATVGAGDAEALDTVGSSGAAASGGAAVSLPMILVWILAIAGAGAAFGTWLTRVPPEEETDPATGEHLRRERALERAQVMFARAMEAVSRAQRARGGIESGLALEGAGANGGTGNPRRDSERAEPGAALAEPGAALAEPVAEPAETPKPRRARQRARGKASTTPSAGEVQPEPLAQPAHNAKATAAKRASGSARSAAQKPRSRKARSRASTASTRPKPTRGGRPSRDAPEG